MNARAVNVAILLLLAFELVSSLGSFLVGEPDGQWLFWLHRAGGLALVVLLAWKAGIAARSYRRRGLGIGTGLSALFGVLFLGSLATGLLWAIVGLPRIPVLESWTGLSLHVALSVLLIPLFVVHAFLRWPRPSWTDLVGRRAVLRTLGPAGRWPGILARPGGFCCARRTGGISAALHRLARGGKLRRQPPPRHQLAQR